MNKSQTYTPAANAAISNHSAAKKSSLVPKGITIGLAIFSLILSLAGYAFRILSGEEVGDVWRHAAVLVPAFVLGIPLLFWLGSKIFNKLNGVHIEGWNAISLGCLTACISMLWLMGGYS
ncbi:hypothetical protein [Psychrobacter urativorans]|uniref:Uncharacterized protein n=1 Tax=Psychrobacter urativorans TaxID=45610 RepID=A0A0M5TIU1_9GAMM|nr:hypothetical protein [Psychrobacter urativorans]ALF59325.1 hypothetical protein AOC03_04050 [Psychrobacter urativorans]